MTYDPWKRHHQTPEIGQSNLPESQQKQPMLLELRITLNLWMRDEETSNANRSSPVQFAIHQFPNSTTFPMTLPAIAGQ